MTPTTLTREQVDLLQDKANRALLERAATRATAEEATRRRMNTGAPGMRFSRLGGAEPRRRERLRRERAADVR